MNHKKVLLVLALSLLLTENVHSHNPYDFMQGRSLGKKTIKVGLSYFETEWRELLSKTYNAMFWYHQSYQTAGNALEIVFSVSKKDIILTCV